MSGKMTNAVLMSYFRGQLSAVEAYDRIIAMFVAKKITNGDAERAAKVLLA